MNTEQVNQAYSKVIKATKAAQVAGIASVKAKQTVERSVMLAMASGEIIGKNATIRDAEAFRMFEKEYEAKDTLEEDYKTKSLALTLAQLELNCLRDCIRVEELTKK